MNSRPQQAYPAMLRDCPAVQLLSAISNRWVALVIGALGASDSLRYGQISRAIPGVSQKMLTQTLRTLERDGILTRTVTPTVPLRVGLLHELVTSELACP